jgi:ParB-like chromosome segregation protein Spo0J
MLPGTPEYKQLSIDELQFDPTNPRLAERVGPNATQAQIRGLLLGEMEARDLVPSLIANGYLPYEPLIVKPHPNGRYVVLEGNRRLAAVQAMRDSDDEVEVRAFLEKRLGTLPCLIFTGDERQELSYLGLRHISKTKDWSAAAKSAFVERVLRSGVSLKEAARLTNTSSNALRQMLLVRRLFERAGQLGIDLPLSRAEGEMVFWHLGDAVRRTNTREYLEMEEDSDPLQAPSINEQRFERLISWVYGNPKTRQPRLITSIRDIPDLDACLGHERSTEALEAGASIRDALEEARAAGAKVSAHLGRARDSVGRATGALSDVEVEGVNEIRSARGALSKALEDFDLLLRNKYDEKA